MAKFALVSLLQGRVCQLANSEEEKFEVAGDLTWIECGDEVDLDYDYINQSFVQRPKIMTNYQMARKVGYGDVGKQLGDIYDAIAAGGDANEALTTWAARQEKVKILFPKGDENQVAVDAAQREVSRRLQEHQAFIEANGLEYYEVDFIQQVADEYIAGKWINPVSGPYKG
jgi:hypothetical protein